MSQPIPTAKLIPKDGWLSTFCDYTSLIMSSPPEFQLGVGLATLSAAIGRGCWFRLGGKRWHPHLWIILVGGAGANKSTPVYTATELLAGELGHDIILPRRWSPEAFYTHLSKNPDGFWNVGELAGWLGGSGRDYMRGSREDLCDLWDSPPSWKRATRKDDTPTIERPAFTAIASARPTDFEEAAGLNDFASGFLSRFLLINAQTSGEYRGLRSIEGVTDDYTRTILADINEGLHKIALWRGGQHQVTFHPEAEAAWENYDQASIAESDTVPELLHGWAKRRGIQALKLSVLHAFSRHQKPEVEGIDVAWAIALIDSSWHSVKTIALDRIGLDKEAQRRRRITDMVTQLARDNGGVIKIRDVLRKTRLVRNKKDLDQWIETWDMSGELILGSLRATAGPAAAALWLPSVPPPSEWEGAGKQSRWSRARPNDPGDDIDAERGENLSPNLSTPLTGNGSYPTPRPPAATQSEWDGII